jgi:hypothetical protein
LVHSTPLLQKIKAEYAMVCDPGSRSNARCPGASGPGFWNLIRPCSTRGLQYNVAREKITETAVDFDASPNGGIRAEQQCRLLLAEETIKLLRL